MKLMSVMQQKFFLSTIIKNVLLKRSLFLTSFIIALVLPDKVIAQHDSNYKVLQLIARVTDGGSRNIFFIRGSLKLAEKSYKKGDEKINTRQPGKFYRVAF